MQAKTLFSPHFLDTRLETLPEWADHPPDDPREVFEQVRTLWEHARQYGEKWNEAQTEQEFIQPMLKVLGWETIVQPKSKGKGRVERPDYALFGDGKMKAEAQGFLGEDDPFYRRTFVIAEAKRWGRPLSAKDSAGMDDWKGGNNPSYQMVSYLTGTRVSWGILTNGITWRLYSREVSSVASEYYEVDLGVVLDYLPPDQHLTGLGDLSGVMDLFKRWWLFFRRAAFTPDGEGKSFVQRVHEGSATYAREISDKLKDLVFKEVMPEIAGGFVAFRYHEQGMREETAESLAEVYRASLSLLYKLLFIAYAEARALLPLNNAGYKQVSLRGLADWAAYQIDHEVPLSSATHATGTTSCWICFTGLTAGMQCWACRSTTAGCSIPIEGRISSWERTD